MTAIDCPLVRSLTASQLTARMSIRVRPMGPSATPTALQTEAERRGAPVAVIDGATRGAGRNDVLTSDAD
jgi:hypothetical protein